MADGTPKSERERKLDWLIDRAEIEDVLASYSRGIDRCDPQVLKSVYHPHGYDEHGIFSGPGYGFADFIIPQMLANYVTMQHHFSTTSIDIRGDEASVESYFLCIMLANDRSLEAAKLLLSLLPPRFTTVKWGGGGSEANEQAIKMARQYHRQAGDARKFKILSHYRGYHGATGFALSATGWPHMKTQYEPMPGGEYCAISFRKVSACTVAGLLNVTFKSLSK